MSEIIESEIKLVEKIKQLILLAQDYAIRAVDFQRVLLYWNIGKRIFEEEQGGKERVEYGKKLIKNLSDGLEPFFGSVYSVRQLELIRKFYRIFPIANTLRSQLNLKTRMSIRRYYEKEAYI